jgi:hypothetical protein
MVEVIDGKLNIRNPNTGLYESLPLVTGESAYETAVRNGFVGSESKWLETSGINSGYAERAAVANYTKGLNLDKGLSSSNKPIYFNEEGRPLPIKYNLGNSCALTATDDPDDIERKLITNVALQAAIQKIIDEKSSVYTKAIVPSPNGDLTYNGTEQSPEWLNFDENIVKITGDVSATGAGTYTAVFTPIAPNLWVDGTGNSVEVNWTIRKATGSLTLDSTNVILDVDNLTKVVAISKLGDGIVSIANSNPDVANATIKGDTITITGDGSTMGDTMIVVSMAEGSNHKAPASKIITVSANYIRIVTWADGSETEISEMLEAHYLGKINISEYWSIGDIRNSYIRYISKGTTGEEQYSQDIQLVIIGFNHDTLETNVNSRSKAAVTIQVNNSLNNAGYMNSKCNTQDYSLWKDSARRTWCNNDFVNSLPELKSLIRPVIKVTNRGADIAYSNYRGQEETVDTVFLLSDSEIFGNGSYLMNSISIYGALNPDGTQYEYMETLNHRIKTIATVADSWYGRSSYIDSSGSSIFIGVEDDGECNASMYANRNNGIAPAFCL